MKNSDSYFRLFCCYSVCFFFLIYAAYGAINIKPQIKVTFTDNISTISQNEIKEETPVISQNKEEKQEEKPTKKEENKTTQSQAVSAEAIKGKVITRYISPYNASASYNGVYLKNLTGLNIDIKALLNKNLDIKIEKNEQPQVLIMHTHTTESFMEKDEPYYTEEFKARTTDNNKNMVKIGEIIAKKLNADGIKTIHDKTKHDYPEYTGSYGRAANTISQYLKKYPSIKIVLDLHRDSVTEENGKSKLVTEIDGKKAAQVMLVMGSESGSITNHPHWKENLSLAMKLQQTIEAKYPTLARPLMLASKKYNQSLSKGSLLIEFGTEVNTLEEASYSAELVAESIVSLLNTMKKG